MSETPSPPPTPNQQPASIASGPGIKKLLLIVTSVLLLGWFAWLSYTALTKSREPIVSRAQAAGAKVAVVVTLNDEPEKLANTVTVVEPLTKNGPTAGSQIHVANLHECTGYTGPGDYLFLLTQHDVFGKSSPMYVLVGQQRSPGADLDSVGPPAIYKWGPDVRAQVKRLFP